MLTFIRDRHPKPIQLVLQVKRIIDVSLAAFGLVLLTPLFLVVGLLIKVTSPGRVFFRQERAGQFGRPFKIFKFRSMLDGTELAGSGYKVKEKDWRITSVGAFLRKMSIDEVPQLINVLRGEMSLVGPRPALIEQVEGYDEFQRRRLLMPPGLTGWAQVNGRNELTWEEKIEYDVWYVDNFSLALDARILARTIPLLFTTEKIYHYR